MGRRMGLREPVEPPERLSHLRLLAEGDTLMSWITCLLRIARDVSRST